MMTTDISLSACHVRWSAAEAAFIARSDQHPGLVCRNEWSSLAAIEGLLVLIERHRPAPEQSHRPAA
ncbi:hypothetical protein [Nocardia sp. NPDC051570]|uniref:hypothetical protein n=1 Tax=Nocardia sp. NPDC051570 TaxID=3364324 RepID=UPI0037AC118F